jgi:hypothetical protein
VPVVPRPGHNPRTIGYWDIGPAFGGKTSAKLRSEEDLSPLQRSPHLQVVGASTSSFEWEMGLVSDRDSARPGAVPVTEINFHLGNPGSNLRHQPGRLDSSWILGIMLASVPVSVVYVTLADRCRRSAWSREARKGRRHAL